MSHGVRDGVGLGTHQAISNADWGGVQTGLSVSSVNMPSGRISSRQIGLVVSWDGRFRYFDAGEVGNKLSTAEHTGLGFDRLMLDSSH